MYLAPHPKRSAKNMKSRVLVILLLFLSIGIASSSIREHQEFQISQINKKSVELISNVNKEQWMALNLKDSALSVTISMDEDDVYSLVFVIRYEAVDLVNEKLASYQTINFVTVSDATSSSQLSADGIKVLEKALSKMGSFSTESKTTYNNKDNPLESIQKVSCKAFSEKEVRQLIIAYFSSLKQDLIVWEDGN